MRGVILRTLLLAIMAIAGSQSVANAQWRRHHYYQPLPQQQFIVPAIPQPNPLPIVMPVQTEDDSPFADGEYDPNLMMMHLPAEIRAWFRNPDGSCVQCSEGMVGVENNLIAWTTLLWDTEYGHAERGGSYPSRVANYARKRGMRLYNVTGDTWPWIEWCAKTGRFAAIGAGSSHFQTLYGRDFKNGYWYVCNNNSTDKIDRYDWAAFQRLHRASGEWVVIPDEPACPPPPELVEWWR